MVADVLRPGGRLFIREGHPMLWTLDDERDDDLLVVEYPYFERDEPMIFDRAAPTSRPTWSSSTTITHEWNHGLGEIISVPARRRDDHHRTDRARQRAVGRAARPMEQIGGGEWRLKDRPWRLPHSYTLQAVKA